MMDAEAAVTDMLKSDGWYNVGALKEDFDISYSGEGAAKWKVGGIGKVEWVEIPTIPPPEPPVEVQKCPHCERDWHPEPLTQAVASMLARHNFSVDYDPDTDDSDIVCIGANYEGPKPPPRPTFNYTWATNSWTVTVGDKSPAWVQALCTVTDEWLKSMTEWPSFTTLYTSDWKLVWTDKPEPCELPDELPDVKFEPAHWNITTDHWVSPQHAGLVSAYWHDFHADPTPIPESPGMDFSQYDTGEISYPTSGKKGKK